MNTTTEWAVFRQSVIGGIPDHPMEGRTFQTLEAAQKFIGHFRDGDHWLMVKSRQVTEWTA